MIECLSKPEKARARQQCLAREEESDHEKVRFAYNRRSVRDGAQEQIWFLSLAVLEVQTRERY